jgi:hypothetical protein
MQIDQAQTFVDNLIFIRLSPSIVTGKEISRSLFSFLQTVHRMKWVYSENMSQMKGFSIC